MRKKIVIKQSPTADSRTAKGEVSKEQLRLEIEE